MRNDELVIEGGSRIQQSSALFRQTRKKPAVLDNPLIQPLAIADRKMMGIKWLIQTLRQNAELIATVPAAAGCAAAKKEKILFSIFVRQNSAANEKYSWIFKRFYH